MQRRGEQARLPLKPRSLPHLQTELVIPAVPRRNAVVDLHDLVVRVVLHQPAPQTPITPSLVRLVENQEQQVVQRQSMACHRVEKTAYLWNARQNPTRGGDDDVCALQLQRLLSVVHSLASDDERDSELGLRHVRLEARQAVVAMDQKRGIAPRLGSELACGFQNQRQQTARGVGTRRGSFVGDGSVTRWRELERLLQRNGHLAVLQQESGEVDVVLLDAAVRNSQVATVLCVRNGAGSEIKATANHVSFAEDLTVVFKFVLVRLLSRASKTVAYSITSSVYTYSWQRTRG